jgi:threonine dehydratase
MIDIKEIRKAEKIIGEHIIRTPLVYSPTFSRIANARVYLKLENLQKTGSFKVRGATYKLLVRKNHIGKAGVVAASAGNHGQGVALAARNLKIPAVIVMPEWASIAKQEATTAYGGEVVIHGQSLEDCLEKAFEIAGNGKTLIHPFDDEDIITGQGTIGLEILSDLKDADVILVPVGGGGLISGIASAVKSINPKVRIIGVQSLVCPSATKALSERKPVQIEAGPSIADGINVRKIGSITYNIIRSLVDEMVLVDEEHIAAAVLMLLERKKILAEGAGAVCLAALLSGAVKISKGDRIVLVISGGNVDSPLLGRIITQGLLKHGRIMSLRVMLDDHPGSLAKLLTKIADLKANVLRVNHKRNLPELPASAAHVDLEIETRGPAHINKITSELQKTGYKI